MSAFLFGDCGCCRGSLLSGGEGQVVVAALPFTMGWRPDGAGGWEPGGDYLATWSRGIPDTIYLTRRTDFKDGYDGSYLGFVVDSWNIYGKKPDWAPWPVLQYPHSVVPTYTYSDPYTYQQCTNNAVKMLDQADLINPDRIYPIAAAEGVWGNSLPVYQAHLCYGSENAAYVGFGLQTLFVKYDLDGNFFYSTRNFVDGVPVGYSAAMNGDMPALFAAGGTESKAGWVYALKSANRRPQKYLSSIYGEVLIGNGPAGVGSVGYQSVHPTQPEDLGPGELLFYPSDVPGLGTKSWSIDPAPGLPPAKTTADSTKTTADTTTETADEQ